MFHALNNARQRTSKTARRTASLPLEALEDRLALSGVTVDQDQGNVTIRGSGDGDTIEVRSFLLGGREHIEVRGLNGTTVDGAPAVFWQGEAVTGSLDIDLGGGEDLVKITGLPYGQGQNPGHRFHGYENRFYVGGNLVVRGAKVEFDQLTVMGNTELHLDPEWSLPGPSRITNADFGCFGLGADFGVDLEISDAFVAGDAGFTTWHYGTNRLSFDGVTFVRDLDIGIVENDPPSSNHASYALSLNDVNVLFGETDIETGHSATVTISGDSSFGGQFFLDTAGSATIAIRDSVFDTDVEITVNGNVPGSVSFEEVHFAEDFDLDVTGAVFTEVSFREVDVGYDTNIHLEGMTERVVLSNSNFAESFCLEVTEGNNQINHLIVEDCGFVDADIQVRDNGGDFLSQGAPEVRITRSSFLYLDLEMSDQHNDEVWLDGLRFGRASIDTSFVLSEWFADNDSEVTIELHDGNDFVHLTNTDVYTSASLGTEAKLTLDGGDGDDGWSDDGGNVYRHGNETREFRDILEEDSITRYAITTSASAGLLAADLTGAQVTGFSPARDAVRVTFSESIDTVSFTAADVTARSNGKGLAVASVSAVAGSNDRAFDIRFRTPATVGLSVSLGTGVLDRSGNALNQDGDDFDGETSDGYTWQDYAGPRVLSTSNAPGRIRVEFDQAVDPATFGPSDVTLTDLKNKAVTVIDVQRTAWTGGTSFDILIGAFPAGGYQLTIGPEVADLFGNRMNQNNNKTSGEKKGDSYSLTFEDSKAPEVSTVLGSLFGATIVFTEAVDPETLTANMLSVRDTATGKLVTDVVIVATFDPARFHILVDAAAGTYELDLGAGVTDLFGNRMTRGQKATFTIDPPATGNRTRELMDVVRMTRDDRFAAGIALEDWAAQLLTSEGPGEAAIPPSGPVALPAGPVDPSIVARSGIPLSGMAEVATSRTSAMDSIFAEPGLQDVLASEGRRPGTGR